jgi:hypothetical protein
MADEINTDRENDITSPDVVERPSLRVPVALVVVALFVWFIFQTVALVIERDQLRTVNSNFEAGMREAEKMRAQLDALVTKTAELASKGNVSAKAAVDELAKKGIPISSTTPPGK